MTNPPTTAQLLERYVSLRDQRDAAKKTTDEFIRDNFTKPMEELEQSFLQIMQANGLTQLSTETHTVYQLMKSSVSTADAREFRRHIIGAEEWDAADWRPNKTYINELADAGKPLPPGVNRSTFLTVGIRKK